MTSFSGTPDIMTCSGRFFSYIDTQPDSIDISDIAHALSMTCRFAGQTLRFYSVAEHSVRVSEVCDPRDALAGLLHDAAEAYLTDMPSPAKRLLPDYKVLEQRVFCAIARKFGVPSEIPASVKHADGVLLATEARDLCAPGWEYWGLPHVPLDQRIVVWTQEEAKARFLDRFACLNRKAMQILATVPESVIQSS